jgi:hypothetical protein
MSYLCFPNKARSLPRRQKHVRICTYPARENAFSHDTVVYCFRVARHVEFVHLLGRALFEAWDHFDLNAINAMTKDILGKEKFGKCSFLLKRVPVNL